MSATQPMPGTQPPLRVEGELTIFSAAELMPRLLATPAPAEIDLRAVTDIDTAGVQLLMLARREALAAQRELRLVEPSPAVAQAITLLGLATYFGDALVAASLPSGEDTP